MTIDTRENTEIENDKCYMVLEGHDDVNVR